MKFPSSAFGFAAAVLISTVSVSVSGQEMSKEAKVDIKNVKVEAENTPQFQVQNVVDKRWRPKVWLSLDVTFDAKKAPAPGDTSPMIDMLEFRYYVGLNARDQAGKYVVLTATVNYLNITEKEPLHALIFAAPASLTRILQKPAFMTSDIKAIGVEVYKTGALAGWYSSAGTRWWESLDTFAVMEGILLPKAKTPFAPLWGDYDLETQKQGQ